MREKDARFAPPREHRKDAPVANGFVHQFRSDGAIDAAADGTYNPTSIAAYFADTSNFFPYKLLLTTTMTVSAHIPNTGPPYRCTHHSPVILAAADIVYEPGDDLLTARRVRHLRMKLNTVNRLRVMRNGSIRCGLRMADDMKIWRRSRELIAMRHPHLHSGNPTVRSKIGQPQHVAWAVEREDGGRGFGFTGGHFHRNWGNDNFRKLVLNALLWTAKAEVPENGVECNVTDEDLKANLDPKGK